MNQNKLFTYDRLSDFVQNYTQYVDKKTKEESNPETENYKYVHFEESLEGIVSNNIGRFRKTCFSNVSNWKPLSFKNGLDVWKLNLAKYFNDYKAVETEKFNSLRVKGLKYRMNFINDPVLDSQNEYPNIQGTNLINKVMASNNDTQTGIMNSFSEIQTTLYPLIPNTVGHNDYLVGINWHGFIVGEAGRYKLTCNNVNAVLYVWVGDESVCEYKIENAVIKMPHESTNVHSYNFTKHTYLPIRVQCFVSSVYKNNFTIDFKIEKMLYEGDNMTTNDVTDTSFYNCDETLPLVMYSSFVSENNQDFLNDQFLCYVPFTLEDSQEGKKMINVNNRELKQFYNALRENLKDAENGKFDHNQDGRLSYGIIPNINVQYTIIENSEEPFAYSIYHLSADSRMGKTYQVRNELNNSLLYPMTQFGDKMLDSILEYSGSYREKPGYYPNNNELDVKYYTSAEDIDGLGCKEKCNKNGNCKYYFTYTSNGKPKCIINSDNKAPHYNRMLPINSLQPIDKDSSSLFLRNYQLDVSGGQVCDFINNSEILSINNNSNYSNTFEYADYMLDNKVISEPTKIGICGDDEFIKHQNDAYNILHKHTTYYKNGTWKEGFIPDEKYTQAISDTGDSIRNNLNNEGVYGDKMEKIDSNYQDLQKKIPTYKDLRQEMMDNPKYDYANNELLYFRNKLQPNVRKKRVIDNNELFLNSEILFTLGTVTAATLIVLAIVLARE